MNNISLFIANASGSLSRHKALIETAFEKAVNITISSLRIDNIDVVCIDDPNMVIPEIGIGGYTPGRHLVYLYIDTSSEKITEQEIINTLCHEFYHARSYDGPGYGKTLFDSIIFEGLATAFEEESSNGDSYLSKYLKRQNGSKGLFQKVRDQLNSEDFNHFEWFIYDKSNVLPRWAGYQIGLYIVSQYLNATNKKASEIILEDLYLIEDFADDALGGKTLN